MEEVKTIAIMTSGGDSPGMNAAIRAVTKAGIYKGFRVIGIHNGFKGMVEGDMDELTLSNVENIMQYGGTILGTARLPEFKNPEVQDIAVNVLKTYGISGLVVIGGDGSFTGAQKLSHKCEEPKHNYKCNVVCLPGTIDNDLACTDFTIGFDTALNTIIDAVDKIRDTMLSHGRCCVVEIMGNRCGDLSLFSSINTGAESLIVAEKPESLDIDRICQDVAEGAKKRQKMPHRYAFGAHDGSYRACENNRGENRRFDTSVCTRLYPERRYAVGFRQNACNKNGRLCCRPA